MLLKYYATFFIKLNIFMMLEELKNFGITTDILVLIVFSIMLFILLYVKRQYIKDSIRELKHVVWPTQTETTNYFVIVVIVLVLFGLYLFVASTLFTKGLFGLKDVVNNNGNVNEITLPANVDTDLKIISTEAEPKKIELENNSTWSSLENQEEKK